MRRAGIALGAALVVLGLFWAGRMSGHGLGAFAEHWWCASPLAAFVVGAAGMAWLRRFSPRP